MSIVRSYCDRCGDVRVGHEAVIIRVRTDDGTASCRIRCPQCGRTMVKPANDALVALLNAVGVPTEYWDPPRERRGVVYEMPPLTHADLRRFRDLLDGVDDLVAEIEA